MGKRTKSVTGKTHALRPRDYWPTIDPKAIPPLLRHLPKGARYAEPMAGNGSLIRLIGDGADCLWASDLSPQGEGIMQRDVFQCGPDGADAFVTNPPWTRAMLHQIILHLSDQAPTYLLFDADWLNTQQAGDFMERCRKVIHVGRLIWIEDTTNGGFTACCWYLFDKPIAGSAPTFYGFDCLPAEAQTKPRRVCHDCGQLIDRFGKWSLQKRGGTMTPVHKNCTHPSTGAPPKADNFAILEWIKRS